MTCIEFSDEIAQKLPLLELGCIYTEINIKTDDALLHQKIQDALAQIEEQLAVNAISALPAIQSSRAAYKALGKEPSRYRLSAEALLRRIVKGKGLYRVNNAVDALNLVSAKSGFSIGGYDVDRINGTIRLGVGESAEPYEAIGRGVLNIEFLPVFRDDEGAFGSPTSDSTRTMVTADTKRFLMLFFNFGKHDFLQKTLEDTVELFENYLEARHTNVWIECP